MGNLLPKNPPPHEYDGGALKFDRILDAENQVYIGMGDSAFQVIRIGDYTCPYHRLVRMDRILQQLITESTESAHSSLVRFTEDTDTLHYEFEHDITMTIQQTSDIKPEQQFHMKLVHKHQVITKQIDPVIVKYFKPIDFFDASRDLDKIYHFFHNEKK
jgi:hypothetical protein